MGKRAGVKFRETIFVKWIETNDPTTPYREVVDDPEEAGEIGEVVLIGEYKYVRTRQVRMVPKVS